MQAGEQNASSVIVELCGLSVYTHHGVSEDERRLGQRLAIDVSFEVPDARATDSDRVEDTIDYSEVAEEVGAVATERSYATLERLCRVIAERLTERFGCEQIEIRAAKPEPPLERAVDEVAVTYRA